MCLKRNVNRKRGKKVHDAGRAREKFTRSSFDILHIVLAHVSTWSLFQGILMTFNFPQSNIEDTLKKIFKNDYILQTKLLDFIYRLTFLFSLVEAKPER